MMLINPELLQPPESSDGEQTDRVYDDIEEARFMISQSLQSLAHSTHASDVCHDAYAGAVALSDTQDAGMTPEDSARTAQLQ